VATSGFIGLRGQKCDEVPRVGGVLHRGHHRLRVDDERSEAVAAQDMQLALLVDDLHPVVVVIPGDAFDDAACKERGLGGAETGLDARRWFGDRFAQLMQGALCAGVR
jgi:hypothetical protein